MTPDGALDIGLASVLITAAVSIGGAWLIARPTGVRNMLAQLEAAYTRITQLEGRVTSLETGKAADTEGIRQRDDHIDALEAHIWDGKPPPPPARPKFIR